MLFLMSFTTKTEIEPNKEEAKSPECFEFASEEADSSQAFYGSGGYENDHEVFEYWYDFCEATNNYDEFQFPG